ncbi:MAG: hypothetical protein GXX96_12120 [Planctomycetaceae bacterium]|nr:hypothetical protein [Planctomycetaceae bacterium]
MSSTKPNHLRILASTALLVLLFGGCMHQGQRLRALNSGTCCWQVVDPKCYGYYPTCWRSWPEECQMCVPPDGMASLIDQSEVVDPSQFDVPPQPSAPEELDTPPPVLPNGNVPVLKKPVTSEMRMDRQVQQASNTLPRPVLKMLSAESWPERRPPVNDQANGR